MNARVWLVDDHEVVRRGVAELVNEAGGLEVVGESATAGEALAYIPRDRPDVVVLDVRLQDGDGVELCRELRSRMPGLRCLMLTSFADDEAMLGAALAGAAGFVLKQVLGSDVVSAIRTVAEGGSLLDEQETANLLERIRRRQEREDPLRQLTAQERTVLDLIGAGLTNRQIATRMSLAEKTVKNYVSQLLAKLGMQRRTQAAVLATEVRKGRRS